MDEKGFILGQASATKRTMTREALETGQIVGASQDGSREFISVLAGICADGSHLPPALIYRGDSHDLRSSWVEDVDSSDLAWFAATPSGWTSNSLGLQWLIGLFDRHTKEKAGRSRRLLIIDGHSSHVNMAFIAAADDRRIILLILPPHSTHRLQPLDVGLFSPLAKAYTKGLNDLMFHSLGLVSINKRLFWGLFRSAWDSAFTMENITSSFEATGISPFNPSRVLTFLATQRLIASPSSAASPPTPLTPRTGRHTFRELRAAPSSSVVNRLERGHMKLTAKVSLLEMRVLGLEQAIILQKRKQAKGVRLNILGEEQTGDALLISPGQRVRAQELHDAREDAAKREREEKEHRKAEQAQRREEKEREKQEAAAARAAKQQLSKEKKAALAAAVAARKADREARKLAKAEQKAELARNRERMARKALTAKKRSVEGAAELEAPRKQSKEVCRASGRA